MKGNHTKSAVSATDNLNLKAKQNMAKLDYFNIKLFDDTENL